MGLAKQISVTSFRDDSSKILDLQFFPWPWVLRTSRIWRETARRGMSRPVAGPRWRRWPPSCWPDWSCCTTPWRGRRSGWSSTRNLTNSFWFWLQIMPYNNYITSNMRKQLFDWITAVCVVFRFPLDEYITVGISSCLSLANWKLEKKVWLNFSFMINFSQFMLSGQYF